ncbi:DUF2273 domain-containing protein [Clostridiaceae bacterium 35-E11]
MRKDKILDILLKHRGKITGIFIGLSFSILTIWIGIVKTIFMFLCIYIGYFIGSKIDNNESIQEILDRILPLWKFK